jgi:4-methyl-5(b-hydroxyethyl)-thiazole monophosphate biosynthesis
MKSKVAVHLADGFEEIEAITIIDVLRRAEIDTITVSVTGNLEVAGAHQIVVMADVLFEDFDYTLTETIVLPGGMPGAANLNNHAGLNSKILQFNQLNKTLAAICAAPMVFGNLGILEGKKAVCYPGFEKFLKGADIQKLPVFESGNIITGCGPAAAIQFALKIVEKVTSKDKAEILASQMLVQ